MKPRIFIGSSSEGLEVAERIKRYFSNDYDCFIWNDGIFKANSSFLETLVKSASLFDFGVMVLSADDKLVKRDQPFETPRDNLLFEFGLFLGRVGIDRAFAVVEKGINLPSDLLGISQTIYNVERDPADGTKHATESLEANLESLKNQMDKNLRLGHLNLLPSTSLAISYFYGFVKMVADWINLDMKKTDINGNLYERGKLYIKLPETLDANIRESATAYYKKMGLEEQNVSTAHRNYPIHFVSKADSNVLEIYDMPTILSGIDFAIDIYFKVGHIGKSEEQKLAEIQEMNNFQRVLSLLIQEHEFCRNCVEIIE